MLHCCPFLSPLERCEFLCQSLFCQHCSLYMVLKPWIIENRQTWYCLKFDNTCSVWQSGPGGLRRMTLYITPAGQSLISDQTSRMGVVRGKCKSPPPAETEQRGHVPILTSGSHSLMRRHRTRILPLPHSPSTPSEQGSLRTVLAFSLRSLVLWYVCLTEEGHCFPDTVAPEHGVDNVRKQLLVP